MQSTLSLANLSIYPIHPSSERIHYLRLYDSPPGKRMSSA